VVITHPDFEAALAPLVERRAGQGLRTALVRTDDVYDEFAFGVFDPAAIRALLAWAAAHWAAPAPRFALLVGESSFDYLGAYGSGPANFLPAVMVDTRFGTGDLTAYASDAWYATLGGPEDLVPDLAIGRLSVASAEQARTVVDKTLRYEAQPAGAPWRRQAVLVVDDNDAASLEPFAEQLAMTLGTTVTPRRFYAGRYPVTGTLTADIARAVDGGALALAFAGHGNVALWSPWAGGGYIFDNAAIGRLANGDAMPMFLAATCMNGWVNHPLRPVSMAELWLTHPAGGGAVAWAPSGYTTLGPQRTMFRRVFESLVDGGAQAIGAVTAAAAAQALAESPNGSDIVRMFILLGDPALVVSAVAPRPTATPTPTPTATPAPRGLFLPFTQPGARN
jgi:hypothetical protein